jgi:hypothetical protein
MVMEGFYREPREIGSRRKKEDRILCSRAGIFPAKSGQVTRWGLGDDKGCQEKPGVNRRLASGKLQGKT